MARPLPPTDLRNPIPALERLPAWWLGKAVTRRMLARDAQEQRRAEIAEEHLRVATEYERRAIELVIV